MKSIEIISIPVTDQERAKDFYVNKLGFQLVADNAMSEKQRWVQVALPGGGATLTLVTWFEQMPAGCIRGLVVGTDDIEKEMELLQSKGAELGKIDETPWGRFLSVKDPDGNVLSLHQKN